MQQETRGAPVESVDTHKPGYITPYQQEEISRFVKALGESELYKKFIAHCTRFYGWDR